MRTLSQISLADIADAVRWLSPDKEAFELIAGVLGFKIESDDALDKTIKPLRSSRDTGDREKAITEIANLPQNDEVPPKPSHKEPDVNYEVDSDGSIVVETLSPGRFSVVPSYIQHSDPLDSATFLLSPATKPRPLLPRHQARSFVWELLAQDLPSTEIDCDAIIDQLSRGLIPELRFLNRKSIRKGVHLLVDESLVMLPYSNDVLDLQRSIKNVAGPSLSGVFSFDELPDRGVAKSTGEQLSSYPFPSAETTILLVSDLGVTRPFGYQNVSANEWAGFLKRLLGSGCRVLVVSPYDEDRLGKLHHEGISIVHWGTTYHSKTHVSVQDFARLLSPAALLDTAFIREARIKLFPGSSPGLEADLLFSWMVAVFNSRVVSFRQETVRALREELQSNPSELEKALDFLKKYRAGENEQSRFRLPERVIFEEQLVTDALTENKASVEQALERIIRSLVDDDMNPKLARWAIAVAEELPASVTDAPSYRDLKLAAQLRLGIISQDFHAPDRDNTSDGNRSWLLPKEVRLGIRLENGKLIISDSLKGAERSINVPGTVPRHLVVEKEKERVSVQIWPGQPDVTLPFGLPVDISSPLSGARYRLKTTIPVRVIKVLVVAPSDVAAERKIAEEVIRDWNTCNADERHVWLEAVLWESHSAPDFGYRVQGILNKQIVDRCDCAIGIFWTRIGTGTGAAPGGAVEEIKRMVGLGKPVLLYFSDVPVSPKKIDLRQKQILDDYRASLKKQALIGEYEEPEEFRKLLSHHLALQVPRWFCQNDNTRDGSAEFPGKSDADLLRYQSTLKEQLGNINLTGSPAIESFSVRLKDTFVSLLLSFSSHSGLDLFTGGVFFQEQKHTPEDVMSVVFQQHPLLLVIGDPGSGKTTLLKYYALSCLDNKRYQKFGFREPVNVFYLPLRDLNKSDTGYASLQATLSAWARKYFLEIEETLFSGWLEKPSTLVLLDGLDEISDVQDRIAVCDWIDRTVSRFTMARFVVTSRITGYRKGDAIELEAGHLRADIMDFSNKQQSEFLHLWFKAAFFREIPLGAGYEPELRARQEQQAIQKADKKAEAIIAFLTQDKNRGLRSLAGIPLLLQIMAMLWKEREFLPGGRSEFYDAVLNYMLDYRDRRREIYPLLAANDSRRVLSPVSFWMQEELEKDEADKALMHAEMRKHLKTINQHPSVEKFCENLIDRAGLLVAYGDNEYRFRHKSFREYLASVELARRVNRTFDYLDQLVNRFGSDWWEGTLLFFIGQVDAEIFDAFMQRLFDSPISEVFSQKQQDLLITLVQEAPEKKIDALQKKLLDPETTLNRQKYVLECLKIIGTPAALDVLYQFVILIRTIHIDIAARVEDVIISLGGKIPAPDFDDESTYNEISAKYALNTDSRLRNEVFAIELLKNNIYLQKKENGRITVIIDRNDVQNAVITSRAKGNICKKYITENNKNQLAQKDKEIHKFLSEKITSNKQYEINLSELQIPLRWASGGVFSVVRYKGKTWTPFFFRDVRPFGWNISLGASERHFSKDGKSVINLSSELNNPWKFIAREFLEETLVLNREPTITQDQIAKQFTFGIADISQQRENALKFINTHIECRKKYDNLRVVTTQEMLETANYDVRTRLQATNTDLIIRHGGKDRFHDDVLVCFNLLELGVEIVKIAEYDLADTDYLLDGEILEHYDGNSELIQELVRMPFALISHSYLEDTFGGDFEPNYTLDTAQPSIIGKPIQSEDIHIFDWDVIQRVKILKGDLDAVGIEKKRYEGWYKQFKQYFFDDNDDPTTKNPSHLFTPASVKIVNTYFANKIKK